MAKTLFSNIGKALSTKNIGKGLSTVINSPLRYGKQEANSVIKKTYGNQPSLDNANIKNVSSLDVNDILNEYSSGGSSYGGGPGMIDLSNIMAAYEKEAQSNRDIAKQAYDTRREDLLTSLKRFQEQNARDVQNQQRAYLSNQASLESAIAQADRQNRISAASRGIGGSGLQQLAQLQNLLSQGQTISDMATENQGIMDTLRRKLAEQTQDTDTAINRALADYTNQISSINSKLASNKANIEYQARENAAARAASAAASAAAQEQANRELAGSLSQGLANNQNTFARALFNVTKAKKKDLKEMINPYTGEKYGTNDINKIKQSLYESAQLSTRNSLGEAGIGTNAAISNNALNNLSSILHNSQYLNIMPISEMNRLAELNK